MFVSEYVCGRYDTLISTHSVVSQFPQTQSEFVDYLCLFACLLPLQLLDHETSAANQIPLLMKIDRHEAALRKAIDSGDSNLSMYSY